METSICSKESIGVGVVIDKTEDDKLSYYEKSMLNYQRLILEKVSEFPPSVAIDVDNFVVRENRHTINQY